ncbi:MAG: gas vesicle protein GvpJ [Gemmatimonadales bacterium]|jgi:hypothetical protein
MVDDADELDTEQLVLADLLNHVLDKGVVISGTVTLSIAGIDLLLVDLRLLLTSVETSLRHGIGGTIDRLAAGTSGEAGALPRSTKR